MWEIFGNGNRKSLCVASMRLCNNKSRTLIRSTRNVDLFMLVDSQVCRVFGRNHGFGIPGVRVTGREVLSGIS